MGQPETTGRERFVEAGKPTRFQPGNPGRPKGSRNKLSEDFFKALADDFAKHGLNAIEQMRTERPNEYAKMVAGLMAKEVDLQGDVAVSSKDQRDAAVAAALRADG